MIEHYKISPDMVRQFLAKVKERITRSNELGKDHEEQEHTFLPKL